MQKGGDEQKDRREMSIKKAVDLELREAYWIQGTKKLTGQTCSEINRREAEKGM